MSPTDSDDPLARIADRVFALGRDIRLAAPLGLGKPHRLLNAIYRRFAAQSERRLDIFTALSLTPPTARPGLEKRFLQPFLDRHFGSDFPVLDYARAIRSGTLPSHIRVEEFYLQSGGSLDAYDAQSDYNSLNYTHVARTLARTGIDVIVQLVAESPDGSHLSLSSNPDLTLDLVDALARLGKPRPLIIAEVHPDLPFMGGAACVPASWFDEVIRLPGPAPKLFALPRQPVSIAEHAIGLYASTLVRDGGSLQIGIGALSDALSHALILRHTRNAEYRALIQALWPDAHNSQLVREYGGLDPFQTGLFGASEMIMDGFAKLVDAGVVKRLVIDDEAMMQRLNDGTADDADRAVLQREGQYLHGAFFLGSSDFYRWLRELDPQHRARIGMTRVSHINELYGGQEGLERLQRVGARFFNTCMMMTGLGAAVSDALEDGRVVSGVGGQYNFVAMAHALHDARSVLMFRATREQGGALRSSIPWNYAHVTIPRHLRDVAITEYGIADLRGVTDSQCVERMLALCHSAHRDALVHAAIRAHKLPRDYRAPKTPTPNDGASLAARLAPFRAAGLLPDYPMGSDFDAIEQRLVKALGWLKARAATRRGRLSLMLSALLGRVTATDPQALERMGLAAPLNGSERRLARVLDQALRAVSASRNF